MATPLNLLKSTVLHMPSFPHCDGSHVKMFLSGIRMSRFHYSLHLTPLQDLCSLALSLRRSCRIPRVRREKKFLFVIELLTILHQVDHSLNLRFFLVCLCVLWVMGDVFDRRYLEVGEIGYLPTKLPPVVHTI